MRKGSKVIIGIHGLGNKPPKATLENWWKQAISDGLRLNNYPEANFEFDLVYWADILHPIPIDIKENNKSSSIISEIYTSEKYPEEKEILTFREKATEYLEKYYNKFLVNGVLSLKYPSITDLFIHFYLEDLESYFSLTSVACDGKEILAKEAIIDRFIKTIHKHKGKKILLIAHSMGSIIVHDALIEKDPDVDIDTYVSIGSPLGQKYVIKKYQQETELGIKNKLKVPEMILNNWYNLSDLEDQVAINHEITSLYKTNSQKIKIEDQLVNNFFISAGIRNPHKAYGYLRTPEFSKIIYKFITQKRLTFFQYIRKILFKR